MFTQLKICNWAFGLFYYIFIMGCGDSSLNQGIYTPYKPTQKLERVLSTEQSKLQNETEYHSINNAEKAKKRGRLSFEEISNAYDKVQGNLEKLFDSLSERISEYYMDLSAEGIQSMTQHKLTQVQTKVYLSEQFLLMTLDILQVIGLKTNYEYSIDIFKIFNKSQSVLINYIKEKYPRAGNIFVPGDLMKVFPEFNMVERPQNDMLRNAGICLLDSNVEEIIKKLKKFFNILIDELDSKYAVFQSLLQDSVFAHTVDGKKMSFNYKIGRKLPENMAKFQEDQTQELSITSPELFRMIIKWVTQMEQYLDNPEDEVNEKESYKVYTVTKEEVYFDDVTPDQFESMSQVLKTNLKEVKEPFKNSIHDLLKEMDMFNINLMKILYTTERKQKYVPKHEANVIKYAMYNTKLVSWLLAQKLIMVLQNLIKVGQTFQKQEVSRKVDLVKFNVKDLFRAMVIGNKKQVLIVFENLKKLEEAGRIKIIQIRNRLGTPLNDVMIIFIMKESFIICELQLILSEGQGVSDKVKNIEVLNHFLYELVRSPYGVLSEVAVLLGYKDNKINYEDKITFENKNFSDFKVCDQKHPDAIKNYRVQKKPFICTNCTEFYHPYENIFGFKSCEKCFIFQCCRCLFKNRQELEDTQVNQKFSQQLCFLISDERTRKSHFSPLSKDVTIDDLMKCFHKKKFFFKNIFKKHYQKLQPKDIHSFIKHKNYEVEELPDIRNEYEPYFLLVQFKGEKTYIKSYFWNTNIEQIQNCFDQNENFYGLEKVSWSSYDFLIFFNTTTACMDSSLTAIDKHLKFCIHPDFLLQNVKKVKTLSIPIKSKEILASLILKVEFFHTNKLEGIDQQQQQIAAKKQFLFNSISDARKSLPNVGLVQENFQMKNCGITTPLLNEFFAQNKQKAQIKTLNLSNNKITDIQVILKECLNMEALLVSKNFIKDINIVQPLKNLKKLVAFQNKLAQITGFANVPVLRKLNLQSNFLKKLEPMNIKTLQELIVSENQFENLQWLQKSTLPSLDSLLLNYCGVVDKGDENKSLKFTFPKLRKMVYSDNPTKQLVLDCPQLTILECKNNGLVHLNLTSNKIEQLDITQNKLNNLGEIICEKMETLKRIIALDAGQLKILPKINSEILQHINLQSCKIEDVSNLEESNLPQLSELTLNYCLFKKFPKLNFPILKLLSLYYVNLNNIEEISSCVLPLLEELHLYGDTESQIAECPVFKFPSLKNLIFQTMNFNKMEAFSNSELPSLQRIEINQGKLKELAKIYFPKLNQISLYYPVIQSFQAFNESVFPTLERLSIQYVNHNLETEFLMEKRFKKLNCPKIKQINLTFCKNASMGQILQSPMPVVTKIYGMYCEFDQIPVMNFVNLTQLNLSYNSIKRIDNLAGSNLKQLQQLNLQQNKIAFVPKLSLKKLKTIILTGNQIKQLSKFSQSDLPILENLNLDRNQLQEFPVLKIPTLKQISLADNPLKNLKGLAKSNLKNLEFLSISNCKQLADTEFPLVDLPKVTDITITNCNITSIANLQKSKLSKLTNLTLQCLSITSLPVLKLPKLCSFSYSNVSYYYVQMENKVLLQDIENISKWECPELESLSIKNTNVEKLPVMNLPKLEKLIMESNQIKNAANLKISNLPELDEINFSNNPELSQIALLPNTCLVESLELTGCNLGALPDQEDFKAKNLYLSTAKITSIGKMNLTQTEYLMLQENEIEDLTLLIREVPRLQHLFLNNNKVKSIPDVPFPQLQYLYVSYNCLTEVTLKEKNFPTLQSFQASSNQIEKINEVTSPMLTTFTVDNNKITTITCFKKESNIKLSELKLQNNEISKIEYLPSTNYLYLTNNKLTNLNWVPNSHSDDWNYLFLSQNQIADISGLFNKNVKLTSLSSIGLDNNLLKSLSFSASIPSLSNFSASNNEIQVVDNIGPESLPNLDNLVLSNNKIKKFGPNIVLKKLTKLQLSDNELEQIKGIKCPALYELTMNNCKAKSLDWMAKLSWPELAQFNITSNLITKLPKIDFLPKLERLYIEYNNLENVDAYASAYSEQKKGPFIQFTIKPELPLETKKVMKEKIAKVTYPYCCTNEDLQQEVTDPSQQIKQQPALLELDEQGNVINSS